MNAILDVIISYFCLHDRVNFEITNSWGHRTQNGSWNGMVGMLDRQEIDIGGSPAIIVVERLDVVQYVMLSVDTK